MSPEPDAPSVVTKLLVVEDDREMQYLFSAILAAEDREILLAETGAQAEEILHSQDIALVVLDLILPDTDGRSLLSRMRADRRTAATPVICATSRVAPEIRSDCFARGADAFVEKPFDPERFAQDVSLVLDRAGTRARRAHEDDLTGLLNRSGFLEHLAELPPGEHGVVALKLDGFGRISERWGWGTGERVLYEVSKAMAGAIPADATFARWGGAEFTLCTPGDPVPVGEALLEAIRDLPIEGPDHETFRVTASAGASRTQGGEAPRETLDMAQSRLFQARDRGGNQLVHGGEEDAGTSKRILVAEDDEITATILTHRLGKEGFEVAHYADGRAAYEAAMEETPGMVILDVKMPGMDGFEVLERLRKTPAYADVPIVILSSMGSEADVVRGFDLGADDYILKPFSPAELIARARRLMARGRATDEG